MKRVYCDLCAKKISAESRAGVEHYKKFHPEAPEACYAQFDKTWDDVLTRIIVDARSIRDVYGRTLTKLNETIKLLENENRMRNVLATKLNGIIMILKSDAQPASKDGVA